MDGRSAQIGSPNVLVGRKIVRNVALSQSQVTHTLRPSQPNALREFDADADGKITAAGAVEEAQSAPSPLAFRTMALAIASTAELSTASEM